MSNVPVEFSVNVKGEVTGEDYRGVFKAIPRLSHAANLRRDQLRRDILGPKPEDAGVDAQNIATIFSKISVHLTESPSWWRDSKGGLGLLDEAPVAAVYDNITKIELESLEAVQKAAQKQAEAAKEEAKK